MMSPYWRCHSNKNLTAVITHWGLKKPFRTRLTIKEPYFLFRSLLMGIHLPLNVNLSSVRFSVKGKRPLSLWRIYVFFPINALLDKSAIMIYERSPLSKHIENSSCRKQVCLNNRRYWRGRHLRSVGGAYCGATHGQYDQEPMNRSMQLNYIPITAFS